MIQRAEWYPASAKAEVWTVPAGYAITKDIVRLYAPDMVALEHLATTPECEVYKVTLLPLAENTPDLFDYMCAFIEGIFVSTQTDEPAKMVAQMHKSMVKAAAEAFNQRPSTNRFGFTPS